MLIKDLIGERQAGLDFAEWMHKNVRLDDGKPWDMSRRRALVEIVGNMKHRQMTILKGAQTGFSTLFLGFAIYLLDQARRNVIYFLPTQKMSDRFSTTRMDAFVNRSEYLRSRLRGTDQTGLKEIDTHFLYFVGLQSVLGAISIPSDCNLYDEVDLIDQENLDWSLDRIAASDLALLRFFSVGMFPGIGIDERYQDGDRRRWHVRCRGCRREQVVEDEFPQNFIRHKGEVMLVCVKCGTPLDVNEGRWIPEKPERTRDHVSYRVPQLIMPGLNLAFIWDRWQKAQNKPSKLAKFRCSVLARPDGGDMQPITDEVLQRVRQAGDYYWHDRWSDTITGIGIDMGDRAHIAVAAPFAGEGIRFLHFEEIDVEDLVERVKHLEHAFNAGALVIDALPYKTTSKQVVRSLTRAVGYIQYFKGSDLKEKSEGEGDRTVRVVTVDRDESLDETTDLFATVPPLALLPKPRTPAEEQVLRTVESHLKKLVKEKEKESEDSPARYKKNVANHYGMAINSARIALWLATGKGGARPGLTGGQVVGRSVVADLNW
ncbi:phage terminase large subunit family protein [Desulfofundulus thermosubterraneus]|uniref:Phage terminase large subunit (GpA) n=1 Tax=Desulfofundulus thermosubterraneus DSM 16057 TaxID=1121432 RepID=A0A1M6KLZ7_9FIRM|nr:phage terminase large subunit family protein [Desulfofundulus thermosubterraneus]SHJ60038.1 Phage terminase large subunit (GpA) [Desulfofundulus thermosubterraneus DSM 16057]